jgi:uncharacterized protein YkwD
LLDLARRATTRPTAKVAVLVVGVLALASACLPFNSQEQYLFNHTNQLRREQGIRTMNAMDPITARARQLAQGLAARGVLAHSDLHAMGVSWTAAAENVARAGSVEQVQSLLQASASHRTNMLNPIYTTMGVGTARGKDGSVYVVELFWRG